jgi:hypothetical protein
MAQFPLCPADKARQPPTVFVGQAAVGQHLSAVQNDRARARPAHAATVVKIMLCLKPAG